jgi:hypothetical protein
MPGYMRARKGRQEGTMRRLILASNAESISSVSAYQVAGGQDVRRPPAQRAERCNTALLIYLENVCEKPYMGHSCTTADRALFWTLYHIWR